MIDAVDFGFWTPTPTEGVLTCWKGQGVRRAIIGLRGRPSRFLDQARACLAGGLEVEAYLYLYWAEDGKTQGEAAAVLLRQFPEVKRVWLDVETDDQNPVSGVPANVLLDAAVAVGAWQRGIYTSRTMWQSLMGQNAIYSAWPLWDANYDGTGDTAFYAYGGWTERAMHQYAGSVALCGSNVDLNKIEEEEMTDAQVAALAAGISKAVNDHTDMKIIALIGWLQQQGPLKKPDASGP